jgi:hypothetical protein
MFISEIVTRGDMATAKTGSFYLTETVTLPAANASGARVTGTLDLSAYVNVPTGQAIAIDQVDFIYQVGTDFGTDGLSMLVSNGAISCQLTDLNPGTAFVRADNQSLVASGSLNISVGAAGDAGSGEGAFTKQNIVTHMADLYPDNFGPSGLSDMFIVVNDQLYITAGNDATAIGGAAVFVTARIRCRVVKLSTKDWMAVAIQSTAADN